jgi:ferritin-like metal-binding protein YciE
MTQDNNERLLHWLIDAHAMEKEAETMLQAQATRIVRYPELRQRLELHVEETREQARLLEECIERLGGSTSTVKDAAAAAMAGTHAAFNALMSDEVIKGMGASYAFEHLEIATYEALVIAARSYGDSQTEAACRRILEQERAMAQWLAEHLEPTVLTFLGRDFAGAEAKR